MRILKLVCGMGLGIFLVMMLHGIFASHLCWFWTGMIGFHGCVLVKKYILKKEGKSDWQ